MDRTFAKLFRRDMSCIIYGQYKKSSAGFLRFENFLNMI